MRREPVDEFVSNRWADAKNVLRSLDSQFVERMESTHRFQIAGLVVPSTYGGQLSPLNRLPAQWHRLLEACFELSTQLTLLNACVMGLSASSLTGLSPHDAGVQAMFHLRSWFIHATSLTEACENVIEKSANAYIKNSKQSRQIARKYRGNVYELAKKNIENQRNEYTHLANTPWGKVATERGLWESIVSIGMTPPSMLQDSFWIFQGERGKNGFYEPLLNQLTDNLCESLGMILLELEGEISKVTRENADAEWQGAS